MNVVSLPPTKDKQATARVLSYHFDAAYHEHYQKRVAWTWSHYFMMGLRSLRAKYTGAGPSGLPSPTFRDPKTGHKRIRIEKALVASVIEQGRLAGIDTSPAIRRKPGVSLDGLRGESIALAAAEETYRRNMKSGLKQTEEYMLATYGTAGLAVLDDGRADEYSWMPKVSLVAPWELRPIPGNPMTADQVGGVCWVRWVPLNWLKVMYKGVLDFPGDEDLEQLKPVWVPKGSKLHSDASPQPLGGLLTNGHPVSGYGSTAKGTYDKDFSEIIGSQSGRPDQEAYVEMREHLIDGPENTLSRYTVMLGPQWVAGDVDYENDDKMLEQTGGVPPMKWLNIVRYNEVGSFWGRSFVDRLISTNRELEAITGDMFDNLRKADELRKVMIPTSGGVNQRNLKMYKRDSFVPYQPDYSAPQHQPKILEPSNVGDAHMNVIQAMGGIMNDLAGQGEMFRGGVPGRVDSTGALQEINESNAVGLGYVGNSKDTAWSNTFAAIVGYIRRKMTSENYKPSKALIPLQKMDESALGLVVDDNGDVNLTEYTFPDPRTIDFTIRNKMPRSLSMIEQKLKEERAGGGISPVEFEILAIKEGLDLPTANKGYYYQYQTAWLENIKLFGDGETPGYVEANEFADNHPIHYMVHMELVSMPAFRAASDEVQSVIIQHIVEYHRQNGLQRWPDQLMSVDQMGMPGQMDPGMVKAAGRQMPGMGAGLGVQ